MFRVLSDIHLEMATNPHQGVAHLLASIPWTTRDKDSHLLLAGDIGWCVHPSRVQYSKTAQALFGGDVTSLRSVGTPPTAPNLITAGLPSFIQKSFVELLAEFRSRFRSVTMVAGNHEYYVCQYKGREVISHAQIDIILAALCSRTGVTFLQKEGASIDGVRVLGCTLWAPFKDQDGQRMNDTVQVAPVHRLRELHADHSQWLLDSLTVPYTDGPTIVLTHHLPLNGDHTGYFTDMLNRVAQTQTQTQNLSHLVHTWICGHDHTGVNDVVHGTHVLSCPHGRPGEKTPAPAPQFFALSPVPVVHSK